MTTEFYQLRNNELYHVHQYMQYEPKYGELSVCPFPLGSKPIRYEGEIIYAVIYRMDDKSIADAHEAVKILISTLTTTNRDPVEKVLRAILRLLPIEVYLLTERGLRGKTNIAIGNCGTKTDTHVLGSSGRVSQAVMTMAENMHVSTEEPYLVSMQKILDLKPLGDFYYVDQPKWYLEAVAHWQPRISKAASISK